MTLKNLMENKQLDLNQPFLSVRRFSTIETLSDKANERGRIDNPWPHIPAYKSELKSGPVRNPGNVPFQWEKAPGRPKDERKSPISASKRPSVTPKLPPGMSSNFKQQHCSKGSTSRAATQAPKGDAHRNSDNFPSDKNIAKYETMKDKIERELSSSSEGDEAYLEALDTLSRSESFIMNCSLTGLSGLDGSADVKPSGTFSTDQKTRDFMMGRFLPAAKAMASETTQVANRKQSVQRGQQKEVKNVVEVDKECTLNPCATKLPYYAPNTCREESEDEDHGHDGSQYSARACGLFARFCLRGSFRLLNPVPVMRTRGGSPPTVSSAHRFQNENLIDSSYSTIKNLVNAANEQKSVDGNQLVELHEENSVLRGQSNRASHRKGTSDSPLLPERDVFPSGREEINNAIGHIEPQRRGRSKFRELLANESCSESPVIEKTLYVDSVHNVKCQSSNSSPSDIKRTTHFMTNNPDNSRSSSETVILQLDSSPQYLKPSNVESEKRRLRSKSVESMDTCFLSCSGRSIYDAKVDLNPSGLEFDLIQDAMILAKAKVSDESSDDSFHDFASSASSNPSNRDSVHLESKMPKGSDIEEDLSSITSTSSKGTPKGKIDLESNLPANVRNRKSSLLISSQLPLIPPSPNPPSESWLKRTLPTISTRNPTPWSARATHFYPTSENTVF